MKTAKNGNMMDLNMKELEHAAGGVVVEINGKFWTASDPEEGYSGAYVKNPCDTLEEAQAKARKYGWFRSFSFHPSLQNAAIQAALESRRLLSTCACWFPAAPHSIIVSEGR